jgi:Spy/CpxP family protein refolding chaperone
MRIVIVPSLLLSWCLLSAFPVGCKSHSDSANPSSTSSAEGPLPSSAPTAPSAAPSAQDPRLLARSPRHGGVTGLILRAARESSAPDQKGSILAIQQSLHDAEPPLRAVKDYQADLAAGIRAGKLAEAKLAADYAAIDKEVIDRESKQADALNSLHALLDATARHALVTMARARLTPMFRPRPDLAEAGSGTGVDSPWMKRRLARVTGDLNLDEAEKAKVAVILAKSSYSPVATEARRDAMHKHGEAVLAAFDQDDFDAKKVDLSAMGNHTSPHEILEHEVALIGPILPILTPEQREKLATSKLRRLGHWSEDPEPWSPFEEVEPNLQFR